MQCGHRNLSAGLAGSVATVDTRRNRLQKRIGDCRMESEKALAQTRNRVTGSSNRQPGLQTGNRLCGGKIIWRAVLRRSLARRRPLRRVARIHRRGALVSATRRGG
eukprot:scaffold112891_cov51-Phaeocystis_antarctica.AAC.2